MKLPFFKKKKTNIPNETKSFEASDLEARIFFRDLINSYSDNFSVDTPEDALRAYETIPQLNTVIDRSAKAFISGKKLLYRIDKSGNKVLVEDGDIYKVLKNPHLLQSENEYWETLYKNWAINGIAYTYKGESVGFGLRSLLCLPTIDVYTYIKDNAEYLNAKDIEQIIDYYEIVDGSGVTKKINDVNSIWSIQNASLRLRDNGYIKPENPLKSLEKTLGTLFVINNIKNELLGNHGAIGIINPDSKDSDGDPVALLPKDKKALQDEYDNYGLMPGKNKLIITNTSIKFTSISLKIAELLLNEFEEAATNVLANNMNFPLSLLTSNAKYENKDVGNKELYQNKIIPDSSFFEYGFNKEFKLREQGLVFEFDYSDIVYLQDDLKAKAVRHKIETDILISLNESVSDGKMTRDTAINILMSQGVSDTEAPNLISETIVIEDSSLDIGGIPQEQLDAQANLRGTVGGVQGVLAVQLQVSQGVTDYDAAISILMEFYGLNEETAKAILGTPVESEIQDILNENVNTN